MKPRLGIIDWGIGGVGIYRLIKSQLGDVPVIYFSDTDAKPYGRMSRAELVSRLNVAVAFLQSIGVTHLIVGCNAASTVMSFLNVDGMKIEGVIETAIRSTVRLRPARLALLGGRITVLSGIYRRAFAEYGIKVTQRVAQPLSALIENGDVSSAELREQCRRIVSPVKRCSHLLLACTHYPAIIPVLREFVLEGTVVINPASALINKIKRWKLPTGGSDRFLTTGDPKKMKTSAWNAYGVRVKSVRKIVL